MRYAEGEQVYVKNNLTKCNSGLTPEMKRRCGQVVTISYATGGYGSDGDDGDRYHILEDDSFFWWSNDCFDPIEQDELCDIILDDLL